MLYLYEVKRLMRTYISAVLLLCLLIQVAPLNLLHSHEDHRSEVGFGINSNHTDFSDTDSEQAQDAHHESSDTDCNVCEVQQSLNNQAFTLVKQVGIFNFSKQSVFLLDSEDSVDEYLLHNTSGRAPPLV